MKMLVAIIGYASTATVISASLGVSYLWSAGRLDDEKVFRMVALLHDVDIEKIAHDATDDTNETPPEEPSPDDIEWRRQVMLRNYELKMQALKRSKQNFDASIAELITQTDRFHELAVELENRLEEEGEEAARRSMQQVVQNLELMKPDQAKDELLKILEGEEGVQNTIKIMNAMTTAKLKKILQQFQTADEKEKLHQIYEEMLAGGGQQEVFQNALEELQRLKSQ